MLKTLSGIALAVAMGWAIAAPQVIVIEGTPVRPVTAKEAAALKGEFKMSDGRILTVNQKGRAVFAEIEGVPASEMKATGPTRLVSADGRMDLSFKAAANGSVSGVTLKMTVPSK